MMSSNVFGHARRRRMVAAAAATASVLMAVSAPVAAAHPGSGTGGGTGPNHHTETGAGSKHTRTVSNSTVRPSTAATTSTSGNQRTVLRNTSVIPAPKAAAAQTSTSDPGINLGTPEPGTDGVAGNRNYGAQTNPGSVQLYFLALDNTNAANNTGPGGTTGAPGFNLAVVGQRNTNVANQVIGARNGGSNNAFVGSDSNTVGNNSVNDGTGFTGSRGDNLAVAGVLAALLGLLRPGNTDSGNNFIDGANNIAEDEAFMGTGNSGNSGSNFVEGAVNSVGNNLAVLGNGNESVGLQDVANGSGIFASNLVFLGNKNSSTGDNFVGPEHGVGLNTVFGGNGNAVAGENEVSGGGAVFGDNVALLGNNTSGSAINSVDSGGPGTFAVGVNNALIGTGATNSGDNEVNGANTIGTNFAVVLSNATNPTSRSGDNILGNPATGLFGANFAFVGAGSSGSGNNTAITESGATSGGFNLAVIAPGQTVAEGNNTGGGINIAILPGATGTAGNCDKALCVDLFGMQLI